MGNPSGRDLRLELFQQQLESARQYTLSLLADVAEDEWFWQATPNATHIAWQVGHLAMAEYGLCLFRQRGRQPGDAELLPRKFVKLFRRGALPEPRAEDGPAPAEIREVLARVHAQTGRELAEYPAGQLDEAAEEPYAAFPTRLGVLLFCVHHEMLHAGQIGLLRRLLGKPPIR